MASKFDRYLVGDRRPAYRPVVAKDKSGGYSAEEVNRLLLDAEQTLEAQLRRVEEQMRGLRQKLAARESELAALANLADQRNSTAEAELTARAERLEALAQDLAKLDAQQKVQAEAAAQQQDESARIIAELEQTLTDMRKSRSWRLTRPLRRVSGGKGHG